MKVFLSHASEGEKTATEICLALRGAGHHVFFDADDLPPGGDYNTRIRFVFSTAGKTVTVSSGPFKIDV